MTYDLNAGVALHSEPFFTVLDYELKIPSSFYFINGKYLISDCVAWLDNLSDGKHSYTTSQKKGHL